jgi:ATP-dependent RNA helicase MRH4, mitochondrial
MKSHKKGDLYNSSIHGKAELVQFIMRAYDREAMQREHNSSGKLLLLPSIPFYLARAYWILRGKGAWETFKMRDRQEYVEGSLKGKSKYSRWIDFPIIHRRPIKDPDYNDSSTPAPIVDANLRRFLEKFTVVENSKTARDWVSAPLPKSATVESKEPTTSTQNETTVLEILESLGPDVKWGEKPGHGRNIVDLEKADLSKVEEHVAVPVETVQEEDVAEIWRPNQNDSELRQATFSHPSQVTIAQATKQLRSSWSPKSFYDLNLIKGLPDAIEKVTLGHLNKTQIHPTDIQALAIPVVTKLDMIGFGDPQAQNTFRSFLIAAETGSGKTLAYLIPLINRLKREEEWALRNPTSPHSIFNTHRAAAPRALIIVPTSELAEQIYNILKRLSHEVKFTVCALLPKFDDSVVRKSILSKYIDVLVSTPYRLNEYIKSGELSPRFARYLIIDEADTIFDRSFIEDLNPILSSVKEKLTHLVLCTATIPLALEETLHRKFAGMQRIVAPKIHTAPRRIDFQLVLESDKREALLDTLKTINSDNTEPDSDIKRAIVFCNVREGVREVYEFLKSAEDVARSEGREDQFQLIPFTRDNYDRHTALERFIEPDTQSSKKVRVLITTDMGSRGLDTIGAKNVILYDVPYSSIDLLHRLGRTARAGTRGRAFMLVSKKEYRGKTKEWVNEIRDRLIRGSALV